MLRCRTDSKEGPGAKCRVVIWFIPGHVTSNLISLLLGSMIRQRDSACLQVHTNDSPFGGTPICIVRCWKRTLPCLLWSFCMLRIQWPFHHQTWHLDRTERLAIARKQHRTIVERWLVAFLTRWFVDTMICRFVLRSYHSTVEMIALPTWTKDTCHRAAEAGSHLRAINTYNHIDGLGFIVVSSGFSDEILLRIPSWRW